MDTENLINADLDGNDFSINGNRVGILLIHGFTATTTEVRQLANKLSPHGYTIYAPLLPGHGTSPEDLNSTGYHDWTNKVQQAYATLCSQCDSIFIAGESMGALLSLHLAEIFPGINGVICYSPAIIVKGLWLSMILRYFIKAIPKGNSSDNLLWKGYKVNPVKASAELFMFQQKVKSGLSKITQPVCIFIGGKDNRISLDAGNYLLNKIHSTKKENHFFENSPHCMILGKDLPEIAKRTHAFIQSCL